MGRGTKRAADGSTNINRILGTRSLVRTSLLISVGTYNIRKAKLPLPWRVPPDFVTSISSSTSFLWNQIYSRAGHWSGSPTSSTFKSVGEPGTSSYIVRFPDPLPMESDFHKKSDREPGEAWFTYKPASLSRCPPRRHDSSS